MDRIIHGGKFHVVAVGALALAFVLTLSGHASAEPPGDQSCNGAFQGTPEGSLSKAASRDGDPLADGDTVTPGDEVTFTVSWDTADWAEEQENPDGALDKILDCFQVNGERYEALEDQEKPTPNDGEYQHVITVPELDEGDELCDRARLSGNPSGENESTQKSNILCLTIGAPEEPEREPGTIVVEKQTSPDGSTETFGFTGAITATLGDGQQASAQVEAGEYDVAETPAEGWAVASIVCDDGDSTGDAGAGSAHFVVGEGETVTCVFTNEADSEPSGPVPPAGGPATAGGATEPEAEVLGVQLAKTGMEETLALIGFALMLLGIAMVMTARTRQPARAAVGRGVPPMARVAGGGPPRRRPTRPPLLL